MLPAAHMVVSAFACDACRGAECYRNDRTARVEQSLGAAAECYAAVFQMYAAFVAVSSAMLLPWKSNLDGFATSVDAFVGKNSTLCPSPSVAFQSCC